MSLGDVARRSFKGVLVRESVALKERLALFDSVVRDEVVQLRVSL